MAHIKDIQASYDPKFLPYLSQHDWRELHGYWHTKINRKCVFMHRFIWECEYGDVPKMLDHINRDRKDNRLCNLRPAVYETNNLNNGALNVYKQRTRWMASVGTPRNKKFMYRKQHDLFCHAFKDAQSTKRRFIRERST